MYVYTSVIALPLPIATGGVIWVKCNACRFVGIPYLVRSFRETGTTTARAALCTQHLARMSLYIARCTHVTHTVRSEHTPNGMGTARPSCPIAIHDDLTLAWCRERCRCSNTQRKGYRTYVLVAWRDSHSSHIGGKSGSLQLLPFTLQKSVAPSHDGSWYGAPLAQMTPYKVWCTRCPVHEYWYVCMYPLVRV